MTEIEWREPSGPSPDVQEDQPHRSRRYAEDAVRQGLSALLRSVCGSFPAALVRIRSWVCCPRSRPGARFAIGTLGVVPEPATWAIMIGGFGMAGAMLRRRRVGLA
jgi:hypothetical protein